MPKAKEVFEGLITSNPGYRSIAGYILDKKLYYYVSKKDNIPAAVVVFDSIVGSVRKHKIFTSSAEKTWLNTYLDKNLAHYVTLPDEEVTAVLLPAKIKIFAGEGGAGPLKGGGLYEAAKILFERTASKTDKGETNLTLKGQIRALRYYMLGAFALLGQSATVDYSEGNYIAAMLVDDHGKILSYGVNSSGFHHGEVNMLLNYYRQNPDGKFPSNTLVFSTLTPCAQCSNYLELTRPTAASKIFIGQLDTGDSGKTGEAYGKHLDAMSDPIMIKNSGGTKTNIETLLNAQMATGKGTVAAKIGANCKDLLKQSRLRITDKKSKKRTTDEKDHMDQLIKSQVLEYLHNWIEGVGIKAEVRDVA